jgi:hypothetical protein
VTAYLEWGAEDAAGGWFDVPGRVGGLFVPSLPFARAVSIGFEYAHFGTSCCGNPEWYRHWSFVGSWASDDVTLGHPLGGDGRQAMLYGSADVYGGRVWFETTAFRRDRRSENLFVPGRVGTSNGGGMEAKIRVRPRWEVGLAAAGERGEGWSERNLRLELTHF